MLLRTVFGIMALTGRGLAAVLRLQQIQDQVNKRNPGCSPHNMTPGVSEYGCPAKNVEDSNLNCLSPIGRFPTDERCSAYCEVRLTMTYGPEVPFSTGNCADTDTCSVQIGTTVTVTNTWAINGDITLGKVPLPGLGAVESAFKFGASYSVAKSIAYTDTIGHSQPPTKGVCGYWTLVPYMMTSCGTLTVAETDMPGELEMCNKDVFDTVQNWCNTVAYTDSHGKADGELVFVKMDCLTHTLLPMAAQEAPYQYPGVSIGPNH